MPKVAVVPAAGHGTRLLPITRVVPKELLPLGTRPVIHHVVQEGIAAGIREFVFVTRPGDRRILDYLEGQDDLGTPGETVFRVAEQPEPKGLGDAVLRARARVDGRPFTVMLPDMLIRPMGQGLPSMLDATRDENAVMLSQVAPEQVRDYGIARLDKSGDRILDLVEKPAPDEAPSRMAVQGRYAFTAELFPLLENLPPGKGEEVQLTDAIRLLAEQAVVRAFPLQDAHVLDCGNPVGYIRAFTELAGEAPTGQSPPNLP